MTWHRSGWPNALILPALLAVLRGCWLWLWLELARGGVAASVAAPLFSVVALALFYMIALLTARALLSAGLGMGAARLLVALAGMTAVVVAIWWRFYSSQAALWENQWLVDMTRSFTSWEGELPGAIILLPVLIYLWLRGVLDASSEMYRDDVWGAFIVGFVMIALAGIVAMATRRGLPPGSQETVFVYFGAGLAALAYSSLETTGTMASRRGDEQLRFDRYWLTSVGSVIALMLMAAFVVSALVTPESVARLLRWTTSILDVLGLALYYALVVLAYVVFLFIEPLLRLAERALSGSREQPPAPREMPDFEQQLRDLPQGQAQLPHWLTQVLPWLGLVVVILAVGLAFAVALRRLSQSREKDLIETRESILTRALLREQLASLSRRVRRQRPRETEPYLSLADEEDTRRTIRRFYQALLAAAARRGLARRRDQTPAEYQAGLARNWPSAAPGLDVLTAAYRRARYAPRAPSTEEASAAQQAWNDMQQVIEPPTGEQASQRGDAP